jgi:PKD repeat protein
LADVFTAQLAPTPVDATISVTLPPHSVRVLKMVRSDTPATPPVLVATVPSTGNAGETLRFTARPASETEPILQYTWNFGDGTSVSGANVAHAFTRAGTYQVRVHATGLSDSSSDQIKSLTIHGAVSPSTRRVPSGTPKQLRREAQSLAPDALPIAKAASSVICAASVGMVCSGEATTATRQAAPQAPAAFHPLAASSLGIAQAIP